MLTDREGGPGGGVFIKFHIAKHKLVLGHRYSLLLMVFDPPPPPPPRHPLLDRAFLTRFSIFYNVLDWQKGKKSKQ